MAGVIDYSRFKGLGEEEEKAEIAALRADLDAAKKVMSKVRPRAESESSEEDSDYEDNPLFWTKPPSQRKNPSPRALAIEEMFQKMVYEDRNAADLAEDFRNRGNQAFRMGQMNEAESCFAEALEWARHIDDDLEARNKHASLILSNRAQIHLRRGNNRTALRDAQAALHADPTSTKARFRAIKASLGLKRPGQALELLKGHENEAELAPLKLEAEKMLASEQAKARAEERKMYAARKADSQLRQLLRSRPGVKLGRGDSTRDGTPTLQPDGATLSWPLVLMYPEFSQTDFVQAVLETSTIGEVLALVFAECPVWDRQHHYTRADLQVFFCERAAVPLDLTRPLMDQKPIPYEDDDNRAKRWVRVPMDVSMGAVLAHPLYVIPGVPSLVVVSSKSANFYKLFLDQMKHDGSHDVLDFAASAV